MQSLFLFLFLFQISGQNLVKTPHFLVIYEFFFSADRVQVADHGVTVEPAEGAAEGQTRGPGGRGGQEPPRRGDGRPQVGAGVSCIMYCTEMGPLTENQGV